MSEISGIYRDGHVELTGSVDWPDGTPVTVQPQSQGKPDGHTISSDNEWGIPDDWPDTPENRAEILRRMEAVEPLEMTPEEEAEWHAMLKWFDDYSRDAMKREMGL
jgi:hypothetical protein